MKKKSKYWKKHNSSEVFSFIFLVYIIFSPVGMLLVLTFRKESKNLALFTYSLLPSI